MLLRLCPPDIDNRRIAQVVDLWLKDGVIVYPTDTVYALAASLQSRKAFERICKLKRVRPAKAEFSMMVSDMAQASNYIAQLSNAHFRLMNRNLPGPFTFIVPIGKALPRHIKQTRKSIGIRIADHEVTRAMLKSLQTPLITTSLHSGDDILEYYTDPDEIYQEMRYLVDCVIDSGTGTLNPSTVVDLTHEDGPTILRQGTAELR